VRVVLLPPLLMLPSLAFAAGDISAKDFDIACATTSGAVVAANPKGSQAHEAAFTLFTFYLGRLSGRDDDKMWSKVVVGRVAELGEKTPSPDLFSSCTNFYISKLK
jgi:hypothetical protein